MFILTIFECPTGFTMFTGLRSVKIKHKSEYTILRMYFKLTK